MSQCVDFFFLPICLKEEEKATETVGRTYTQRQTQWLETQLGGRWPVCGLCPWLWHKRVLRWAEGICSAWLLDSQTHCLHYLPKACSHLAPRLCRAALSKRRCLPSGLGSQQRVCSFSLELVENVPAHTQWNPVDVKGVWSSRGFGVWVCRPDHD